MKKVYRDQFTEHVPMVLWFNPMGMYETLEIKNLFTMMTTSLRSRRLADCVYETDVIIAKMRAVGGKDE